MSAPFCLRFQESRESRLVVLGISATVYQAEKALAHWGEAPL